jgi:hypothetical protein
MEKRALIAVIISLIILVLWQQYFAPAPPETGKEKHGLPQWPTGSSLSQM